ncbi:MAG: YcxB family protein [Candidatus Saccharibacteria bacterium]
MKIGYTLDGEDLWHIIWYIRFHSWRVSILLIALVFMMIGIAVLNFDHTDLIFSFLLPVIITTGAVAMGIFSAKKKIISKIESTSGVLGEKVLEANEQGVLITSDVAVISNNWGSYQRLSEDNSFIYLWLTDTSVSAIPKKAFIDSAQMAAFMDIAKAGGVPYK